MNGLMLLCRPGFEADCAAELSVRDPFGYARAVADSGYLQWISPDSGKTDIRALIFARAGFHLLGEFKQLPEQDRIAALLPLLDVAGPVVAVRLEYADTNDGRGLQRFLKRFRGALEGALKARNQLRPGREGRHLHIFFHDSCNGCFGFNDSAQAGLWELGIPRLRLAAAAPSRSAQKLEEAWLTLMLPAEREYWLRAGRTGVDLGAAPGGWTWQLARHGVRMTAVDHGKLSTQLMDEYPIEHVSADAYTYRPPRQVDWLVCDVVDKPARTMACMQKWLTQDWTRLALFNLKLPMKQRYAAVEELLGRLSAATAQRQLTIRAKQLYYDREEITVLALPASGD